MTNPGTTDSIDMVRIAAKVISDKKGYDLVAFDVAKQSTLTDYVVIASGLNAPHLKALVNETLVQLKGEGFSCYRKSGEPDSGWIVADYLDVMIHFFIQELREYYALDQILEGTPKVKL
ncbi:ribosome silencing factor [Verrucomicrobiota bacterium]